MINDLGKHPSGGTLNAQGTTIDAYLVVKAVRAGLIASKGMVDISVCSRTQFGSRGVVAGCYLGNRC